MQESRRVIGEMHTHSKLFEFEEDDFDEMIDDLFEDDED
jgi:hypothetical protein